MLPTHRTPTSPGAILLEEFLLPLGISQMDFVRHLGGTWTQPKLSAIIHGTRSITEEIALDLADALGTSPEFWLGLQSDINHVTVLKWESGKSKISPSLELYIRFYILDYLKAKDREFRALYRELSLEQLAKSPKSRLYPIAVNAKTDGLRMAL